MLTLNQVVKNLNNISDSHSQINNFFFGELYDFASSGTVNYPAMAVTLEPSQVQGNVLVYSFNVYVLDLVHKGTSNNTEVLSDTMQTCLDIIAICNNHLYDWNTEKNTVLNDVQGGYDDEVSGYWFNLKIRVANPSDRCQVPLRRTISRVQAIEILLNGLTTSDDVFLLTEDGFVLIAD